MIFFVQTPHPWRGIRQRPHHLMARFARHGHFVRWIEPRYLRWLAGRREEFFRARAEEPEPNLQVRPVTLVNGERFGPIRAHNKFWMARAMREPLPPQATGPRILWIYNPHEAHLADRVDHDLLVYDMMDEYEGFPWSPPNIRHEEMALLRRADWTFAGTQALYEAKGYLTENSIECILSGVEWDHFAHPAAGVSVNAAHEALRTRYRKLIGYAGMIDLRIDQPLLVEAAKKFPEWGFVLLGPVAADVASLEHQSNIHLLGPKPYAELPAYYHAWDAAMLPFVENELTRHINPTKMLEYAAADLPIIARALPDVKTFYAGGAWLYNEQWEFFRHLHLIEHAAPAVLELRLHQARQWAHERSWDALADRMLARLESLSMSSASSL